MLSRVRSAVSPRLGLALRTSYARLSTETPPAAEPAKKHFLRTAEFWGFGGALAGWGLMGSAIYDALYQGPEVISMNMTPVQIVYSSLFARWAWVVQPRNLMLFFCHVSNVLAQSNQLRRAFEYQVEQGKADEVRAVGMQAGAGAVGLAALVMAGPRMQAAMVAMSIPGISSFAGAANGPFTVHFWAPMSKWLISGANFLDLERPVEKISIAQMSALTVTGFFFMPYALLVTPINYVLCSVNIALFGSSAWHLGRKVKADFLS
mmetsp:Transcript_17613/g.52150  ORF Transcript_17613/g.52150 Transcript_17613/m.52150 type:complete len:263 (-) Transcript_17613:406-1194(-)